MKTAFCKKLILGASLFSMTLPMATWAESPARPARKRAARQEQNELTQHLKQLEEQLTRQQSLISQQQERIDKLEQQVQENKLQQGKAAEALNASVQRATDQAAATEQTATLLNSTVSSLKSGLVSSQAENRDTQLLLKRMEQPEAIRFKGLSLSPGGFIEAATVTRSRNENADISSNLSLMPFDGVANSKLTEFRATSRSTRFSLLIDTMHNQTHFNGYYEIDFLSQAPTSNQVQTNSFIPRQRQLWLQAAFPNHWTFTGGQYWSLITTNRKGLAPRAEFIPTTIEGAYMVGYDYVRQTAFRATKNFQNKVWAAWEVANPETSQPNASYVPDNLFGFNNSANASSPNGSTLNYLAGSTNGFSTNLAPDLLSKVVWEPGWGHYELKALGRFFRDRINGSNNYSYGGGIGAAAILPVGGPKADLILESLAGSGIGRYGAANGSDVTLRPDGKIIPLHALHTLAGLELHPIPRLDIYTYGGDEYYGRAAYVNPTNPSKPAGYGSRLVNNTYCGVEVVPTGGASCGAQNKNIWHLSSGLWYRVYKGPGGTMQYGFQYEHLYRSTWSGIGGAPSGNENIFMTSARYILP